LAEKGGVRATDGLEKKAGFWPPEFKECRKTKTGTKAFRGKKTLERHAHSGAQKKEGITTFRHFK